MTLDTIPDLDGGFDRFLMSKDALMARRNAKWSQYAPDVIPAYVADMDFRVAPAIEEAIRRSVDSSDYGYPMRDGAPADRAVARAFCARMDRLYGWRPEDAHCAVISDLVQATFALVMAFTDPGDGIIVQTPNYPPFRKAVEDCNRLFIPLPMMDDGTRHVFDLDALEGAIDERTRIFMLCNPQNPTGRAFDRQELEAILAFAERHDLLVISDEIHSDIIFAGHRHIPFAALPGAEGRTVVLNSATKSFNIAGLRCAVMCFGSGELKERFDRVFPGRVLGSVNSLGIDATVAAWTECDAWLAGLLEHLGRQRERLAARLAERLPEIRFHLPDATYLAWLDCRSLGMNQSAFDLFHDRAKIAFSPGENFNPSCDGFVRLNFATSYEVLDELVDRMAGVPHSRSEPSS